MLFLIAPLWSFLVIEEAVFDPSEWCNVYQERSETFRMFYFTGECPLVAVLWVIFILSRLND